MSFYRLSFVFLLWLASMQYAVALSCYNYVAPTKTYTGYNYLYSATCADSDPKSATWTFCEGPDSSSGCSSVQLGPITSTATFDAWHEFSCPYGACTKYWKFSARTNNNEYVHKEGTLVKYGPPPFPQDVIYPGSSMTTSFDVSSTNNRHIFAVDARLKSLTSTSLQGSSNQLRIKVNGVVLPASTLINKAQIDHYPNNQYKGQYTYWNGARYSWFDETHNAWSVMYAPDYWYNNVAGIDGNEYGVVGGEATHYEFDISNYLTAGSNTIELIHRGGVIDLLMFANARLFKEIAYSPGEKKVLASSWTSLSFDITDGNKQHFVRTYARLNYSTLAGFYWSMRPTIDGTGLTKYNVLNKPTRAYGYFGSRPNTLRFIDGREFQFETNGLFSVPYSPNYYANNVDGTEYGIIGGEAYRWDFLVPYSLNTIGAHQLKVYNLNPYGYDLMIEKTYAFEVSPLNFSY